MMMRITMLRPRRGPTSCYTRRAVRFAGSYAHGGTKQQRRPALQPPSSSGFLSVVISTYGITA